MNAVKPAIPLTPSVSHWLRRSFTYTPEPTTYSRDVPIRCPTEPRKSCNADPPHPVSRLRPSTKRKRTNSGSMVVSEDLLPRPKAKKLRRKSMGDAAHSKKTIECEEQQPSLPARGRRQMAETPSAADTSSRSRCQTELRGRRMVFDAVEIIRRSCSNKPSDVGILEERSTEARSHNIELRPVVEPMDITTSSLPRKRRRLSSGANASPSKPSATEPTRARGRMRDSRVQTKAASSNSRISRCKSAPPLAVPVTSSKTSKYFNSASVQVTSPVLLSHGLLTEPKSTTLITRSISSKTATTGNNIASVARISTSVRPTTASGFYIASQKKYEALYADLMIMVGKLKPILVQESICDDPWKVLLAVRMLNVTTGRAAIPIFWKIVNRWPTPRELVDAPLDELVELLRPLGLYNKRAKWFKEFSQCYMDDPPRYPSNRGGTEVQTASQSPCTRQTRSRSRTRTSSSYPHTPISHFQGVGPYALDSFRIFCHSSLEQEADTTEVWKQVMPSDKELIRYLKWKWAYEEHKIWYPDGIGAVRDVDVPYLITLVDELAEHYDTTIGGEGYIGQFIDHISTAD